MSLTTLLAQGAARCAKPWAPPSSISGPEFVRRGGRVLHARRYRSISPANDRIIRIYWYRYGEVCSRAGPRDKARHEHRAHQRHASRPAWDRLVADGVCGFLAPGLDVPGVRAAEPCGPQRADSDAKADQRLNQRCRCRLLEQPIGAPFIAGLKAAGTQLLLGMGTHDEFVPFGPEVEYLLALKAAQVPVEASIIFRGGHSGAPT
jgi:hypothetical protein